MTIEFELEYTDMRGMTAWTEEFPTDSPLVEQYLAGEPAGDGRGLGAWRYGGDDTGGGRFGRAVGPLGGGNSRCSSIPTISLAGASISTASACPIRSCAPNRPRPAHGRRPGRRAPRPAALGRHAPAPHRQGPDPGLPGPGAGPGAPPQAPQAGCYGPLVSFHSRPTAIHQQ